MPLSSAQKTKRYEERQAERGRVQKHLWVPIEFGPLLERFAEECNKMHERGESPPADPPVIQPRLTESQIAMVQEALDARGLEILDRAAEIIRRSDLPRLGRLMQRLQLCEDALG